MKAKFTGDINVSIVIAVYNVRELIRKSLPKIIELQKSQQNRIAEIIVVDDASTDGLAEVVKKEFPGIRLIKHTVSRGYAAAINTGARASKGSLVALIDINVIPNSDFLVEVIKDFRGINVFSVSLNIAGSNFASGYFKDGFVNCVQGGGDTAKSGGTFFVSRKNGVFRRDYWMKLGGIDESLTGDDWGDIDLSYRAAKRGLLNLWNPAAEAVDEGTITIDKFRTTRGSGIEGRNRLLFHWKNLTSKSMFRKHIGGLLKRLIKHPGYLIVLIMALSKYRYILKARQKEIREGKFSDESIFAKF